MSDTKRVFNFSPGPATLPLWVLEKAAEEMSNYNGSGIGVMEMSHRSKLYEAIIEDAELRLRQLMNIPSNYKVIFMQGGATSQFSMVPLNLAKGAKLAHYAVTGSFAAKAAEEAARYVTVDKITNSKSAGFACVPVIDPAKVDPNAAYLHITTNNTIYGTRYRTIPKTSVPLIADMSSNILSEVFDVNDFGLIYAGAQKNMGAAGACAVIIRDDLLEREAMEATPVMYNYALQAKNASLYNTPSTYSIYICKLVFEWLQAQGGVAAIQKLNEQKAKLLYDIIDSTPFYTGISEPQYRSIMNVTFRTPSEETDTAFVSAAAKEGLVTLKGHRSAGGIRASIYNAMPMEGVVRLADFMKEFADKHKS